MKCLLAALLALAFASPALATDYNGTCTVTFKGSSTLHDFHGKGKCEPFTVSGSDGVIDMSRIVVPVAGMDTGNKRRDKKMYEMFEEKKFPLIATNAGPLHLKDFRKKPGEPARVTFRLQVRDVTRQVNATVTNYVESGSKITADVSFPLSLAEYQLKPPSVMGLVNVDDKVSVSASFVLEAK